MYEKIAKEIGKLVKEKNTAYGDSFNRAGEILEILYPYGVGLDDYKDMLAIVRIIDKLFRIATDKEAFEESPWRDIVGYALLGAVNDEEEELKPAVPEPEDVVKDAFKDIQMEPVEEYNVMMEKVDRNNEME